MTPLQAAIGAALSSIATVAITFGFLNNTEASAIVSAAVSLVAVAFVIANELRVATVAKAGK